MDHPGGWSIGLATAESPLGPWKKHPKNPVIERFGYVGGVVKAKGKYHLYAAHPIDSTGPDYSPMALATAQKPQGPWTKWQGNPVLKQGPWGEWDDGGFSEAEVLYRSGAFHMFYGGTGFGHAGRLSVYGNSTSASFSIRRAIPFKQLAVSGCWK